MSVHTFSCLDGHTCGNPVRLVSGGAPLLKGATMSERFNVAGALLVSSTKPSRSACTATSLSRSGLSVTLSGATGVCPRSTCCGAPNASLVEARSATKTVVGVELPGELAPGIVHATLRPSGETLPRIALLGPSLKNVSLAATMSPGGQTGGVGDGGKAS